MEKTTWRSLYFHNNAQFFKIYLIFFAVLKCFEIMIKIENYDS